MSRFKKNDLVVAVQSVGLFSPIDNYCILAGEKYIVVKIADGGFGVYLDHCSQADYCSCLKGWWRDEHFEYLEDTPFLTVEEISKVPQLPSPDDVASFFGVRS